MTEKVYLAIDLKSFYASVECIDRGLDPMTTNLVVADGSRTEKTICLAVSPSLRSLGISGRARLFEVIRDVKQINRQRVKSAPGHHFQGESYDSNELQDPSFKLTYLTAPPRMAHYMKISTEIYGIYLDYVSEEDIHVYSVDEVFIDTTPYLKTYDMDSKSFAGLLMKEVFRRTGITATAGIGTNLYLAKVAMDIVAKHMEPDEHGARIAELTEASYRKQLWSHRPITDFWRVGRGYGKKLAALGVTSMGEVAELSLTQSGEDLLYKTFGINAELLIDHAWGWEPVTISDIHAYRPEQNSIGAGQVLPEPYTFEKGRIVIREMADGLSLELVKKRLVTERVSLTVGYDIQNLEPNGAGQQYQGEIITDRYGRKIPKSDHGTYHLDHQTSSTREIVDGVMALFDDITNQNLLIRRMYLTYLNVIPEEQKDAPAPRQLSLFEDYRNVEKHEASRREEEQRERKRQEAVIRLQQKFGKNTVLKGSSLLEGATAKDRNERIGGHKA